MGGVKGNKDPDEIGIIPRIAATPTHVGDDFRGVSGITDGSTFTSAAFISSSSSTTFSQLPTSSLFRLSFGGFTFITKFSFLESSDIGMSGISIILGLRMKK
jgi:hypothetical protein